jgi:Protein of unknown function (DUF3040)
MLNDHERRELALIEEGLSAEGRRWDRAFVGGGRDRRRRWLARGLLAFGILMLVVGLLAADAPLILQGLLTGGAAILWSRWRAHRVAAETTGRAPHSPAHG